MKVLIFFYVNNNQIEMIATSRRERLQNPFLPYK